MKSMVNPENYLWSDTLSVQKKKVRPKSIKQKMNDSRSVFDYDFDNTAHNHRSYIYIMWWIIFVLFLDILISILFFYHFVMKFFS